MNGTRGFRKIVGVAACALAVATTLSACGSSSGEAEGAAGSDGPKVVTISHLADLSGTTKEANEAQVRGMELALASPEVRRLQEEGGFVLRVDRKDTGGDPSRALAAMQRNAANDDIVLQMGPAQTPEFFAAIPLAAQLRLPTYSFMSGGVYPGEFNEWTWRTGFKDDQAIPPLVAYAAEQLGARSAAVIYAGDNDFAKLGGELLIEESRAAGMRVMSETVAVADTSFSAQVSKVADAKPDAVFLSVLPQQAGFIIKALRDAGVDADILASSNAVSAQLVFENSKGTAEGVLVSAPFDPQDERRIVREYMRTWQERYPTFEPSYDVFAYDAIVLVATALASIEGDITRESVKEAFNTVKIEGLTGTLFFPDGHGDAVREGVSVLRLTAPGRFVPVRG